MKLITVYIPEGRLEQLNDLVKRGYFPHRAEAIRSAINLLIEEYEKMKRNDMDVS